MDKLDSSYSKYITANICIKYGCDYQLDKDGQVTCTQCGAMDDDKHVISTEGHK